MRRCQKNWPTRDGASSGWYGFDRLTPVFEEDFDTSRWVSRSGSVTRHHVKKTRDDAVIVAGRRTAFSNWIGNIRNHRWCIQKSAETSMQTLRRFPYGNKGDSLYSFPNHVNACDILLRRSVSPLRWLTHIVSARAGPKIWCIYPISFLQCATNRLPTGALMTAAIYSQPWGCATTHSTSRRPF